MGTIVTGPMRGLEEKCLFGWVAGLDFLLLITLWITQTLFVITSKYGCYTHMKSKFMTCTVLYMKRRC